MKKSTSAIEKAFYEACDKNSIKTTEYQQANKDSAKVIDKSGIERLLTINNNEIKATAIPCFEIGMPRFTKARAKRISGIKEYNKKRPS